MALAVVGVLLTMNAWKSKGAEGPPPAAPAAAPAVAPAATPAAPEPAVQTNALPRLVDLGAGACIPCKRMAPILEDLKKTYAGRMNVLFIDVWKNPEAGKSYGISTIPTQIFYDAAGKELFRHEGFFSKDEILDKWKALGVDLAE
jgi:thioredoxin 1